MSTAQVVVGSSLGALVAAEQIASRGRPVRLITSGAPWGGGFGGLMQDGRVLELGVRLLELDFDGTPAEPPPLSQYQPGVSGHRDFVAVVAAYLRGLVGDRLREVPRPTMFFGGRVVDDLYFTTDVATLATSLSVEDQRVIAAQTDRRGAGVLAGGGDEAAASLTLGEASRANHGEHFHQLLIEPVAEKFVAGGTADVLATHRRKIWMPLFWPETLHDAVTGVAPTFKPHRPFHTVAGGGVGEIVVALRARLEALGVEIERAGRLTSITAAGPSTDLHFEDRTISARRPIIGLGAEEVFAAVGAPYRVTKAMTALAWVEVAEANLTQLPSVLTVVDADVPIARVSLSDPVKDGTIVLTVELPHHADEAELGAMAVAGLRQMGIVRTGEVRVLKTARRPSFALPSAQNQESHDTARAHLDRTMAEEGLDCRLIGATEAFGADTLSEQVIQALISVEELGWA